MILDNLDNIVGQCISEVVVFVYKTKACDHIIGMCWVQDSRGKGLGFNYCPKCNAAIPEGLALRYSKKIEAEINEEKKTEEEKDAKKD
jgi:hypothetical protein